MKTIKKLLNNYLIKSGYDTFIDVEDLYPISFDKLHNKSCRKISERTHFFLMVLGSMDIYFPDRNGKNHLLARAYADDHQLGGLPGHFKKKHSCLEENYLISLSGGAVCFGIKKEKITTLFNSSSFMAFVLERYMSFTTQIIQENYLRNVFSLEEYLAYILYKHAREDVYEVINYTLFSSLLKCERTNLYRVIQSLEKQGILEKNGKILKIKSLKKLKFIFDRED